MYLTGIKIYLYLKQTAIKLIDPIYFMCNVIAQNSSVWAPSNSKHFCRRDGTERHTFSHKSRETPRIANSISRFKSRIVRGLFAHTRSFRTPHWKKSGGVKSHDGFIIFDHAKEDFGKFDPFIEVFLVKSMNELWSVWAIVELLEYAHHGHMRHAEFS